MFRKGALLGLADLAVGFSIKSQLGSSSARKRPFVSLPPSPAENLQLSTSREILVSLSPANQRASPLPLLLFPPYFTIILLSLPAPYRKQ